MWTVAFPQIGAAIGASRTNVLTAETVRTTNQNPYTLITIPTGSLPAVRQLAEVEAALINNNTVVARGPFTGSVAMGTEQATFSFRGLEAWLDRMDIQFPPPTLYKENTLGFSAWRFTQIDEAVILKALLTEFETAPGGSKYALDLTRLTTTGTLRDREIRPSDAPTIGGWAQDLTNVLGGPTIWVDQNTREVRCEATRSVDRPVLLDDRVTAVSLMVQPWDEASVVDGRGAGTASAMLQTVVSDSQQLQRLGRRVTRLTERGVALRQTLEDRANRKLANAAKPGFVLKLTTTPSTVDSTIVNPGDTVACSFKHGTAMVGGRWTVASISHKVQKSGEFTDWVLFDDGAGTVT